jgi:hypothetical protein
LPKFTLSRVKTCKENVPKYCKPMPILLKMAHLAVLVSDWSIFNPFQGVKLGDFFFHQSEPSSTFVEKI